MQQAQTAATLIAEVLAGEGVDHLFTLCGGHISPIVDACETAGIKIVDFRHEQAAVMAADGYARLTGKLGVAAVTAGPGVTNAVTGVANALQMNSPVVVFGGRAPWALEGQGALQEMDQISLMQPITRWAGRCSDHNRVAELLADAIRHAKTAPRGPVFFEVPVDVLMMPVQRKVVIPERYYAPRGPVAPPEDVSKVAHMLSTAERPVLLSGSGVWWSRGTDALAALADRGLPVFMNGLGRGTLPPDHPSAFALSRRKALQEADLAVIAGAPLDFRLGYGRPPVFSAKTRIVHLHDDSLELGRNAAPAAVLPGDVGRSLASIEAALDAGAPKTWATWRDALRAEEESRFEKMRADLESNAHPIEVCFAPLD